MLWAVDQAKGRAQDDRALSLRSHQRARDVKAVLGQELVQVVARHPARDLRKPAPYTLRIPVANRPKRRVDRSAASALSNNRVQFLIRGRADGQLCSVIKQDRQVMYIV